MRKTTALLFSFLLLTSLSFSQAVLLSRWSTFSSLRTVRDVAVDAGTNIWAATSGGVFRLQSNTYEISEFRNINALQSLDIRSVHATPDGKIFFGGANGSLDILNKDSTWTNVTDIVRATEYPKRGINDLKSKGDTLFIGTDFGLITYSINRELFFETIDRIGIWQEKTRVNGVVILNDSVWVATDSGVAVASLNVPTFRLPSVWRNIDTIGGRIRPLVTSIQTDGSILAIATGKYVYTWDGSVFVSNIEAPSDINGLSITNSTVYASSAEGIRTSTGALNIPFTGPLIGHTSFPLPDNEMIIGYVSDAAMQIWDGDSLEPIKINSPLSSQFARMDIDTRGGLWVATDIDPPRSGAGISYYDGVAWKNFTAANTPALKTNACYRVSALSNGTVYVGTWGGGAIQISLTESGYTIKRLDNTNSALQGIGVDPNYVLSADAALDRQGTVWMVNEQSSTQLLASLRSDGGSSGYGNCVDSRNTAYRTLAVDGAGNKWVGSFVGNGITIYNEKGTEDPSDDVCNVMRESNSQLPDNLISVLRTDRSGALWIGTPKGVAVISSPGSVTSSSLPYLRRITVLSDAIVNDIYIDALNYKWVATTGGVFVLNEDGTEVLASVTRSNAPLLDDNIRSVAVDAISGLAYFGTAFGCSVAQSSSIKSLESFSLDVRPQPFSPQNDLELTVDGLAEESDVRILTIGGFTVNAMQSRGRQALWDGRDYQGRYVPPGVYLVVVKSAITGESSVGKILVK